MILPPPRKKKKEIHFLLLPRMLFRFSNITLANLVHGYLYFVGYLVVVVQCYLNASQLHSSVTTTNSSHLVPTLRCPCCPSGTPCAVVIVVTVVDVAAAVTAVFVVYDDFGLMITIVITITLVVILAASVQCDCFTSLVPLPLRRTNIE